MTEAVGPRSLELFFIDGRPDGMLTAEVFNWTGHVLLAPRTRLPAALARAETRFTGVYLLLGEKDGEPFAYIGEAEDMADRIRRHDLDRDWWTQVAFVTTGANTLNKAHVRYLEARLIEEAHRAARARLDNANQPGRPGLSEAARANMEAFLAYLMMVLPAVRVDLFESQRRPAHARARPAATAAPQRADAVVFELESRKHGLSATAHLIDGEFVVQKGSRARLAWAGREARPVTYAALHAELLRSGVLLPEGDTCVFADNYAFASPSAASAVVLGRSSNGTLEWRERETGLNYKDWEAAQLTSAEAGAA
jgi:hypothetical protein